MCEGSPWGRIDGSLPGVAGIGIGKDHIIPYVSNEAVEVPDHIEDVAIAKE